jgi:ADP-heptose:LPS heptosyltransferase
MTWAGIARMGGCGDNLIASSVLPGLKKRFDHVEVITNRPWGVVFENNPHIDRLIYKDDGDITALDAAANGAAAAWQQWFVRRAKEYDFFQHLSHSCEMFLALFPPQTAFWWDIDARREFCNRSYLEVVHKICRVPYEEIAPGFFPTAEERNIAQDFLAAGIRSKAPYDRPEAPESRSGPVIAWVCAGTRVDKYHRRGGLAVARLINELDATVCLFGGWNKDLAVAQEIEKQVRHMNGDLTGLRTCISPSKEQDVWPIRRSLTQIQMCDLVITPDTGPAWAVAALPMPKVMMLSHASAENITKHWTNTTTLHADQGRVPCWPCHRLHTDGSTCVANHDNDGPACMADISIETIVRAAKAALGGFVKNPVVAHPSLIEWAEAAQ